MALRSIKEIIRRKLDGVVSGGRFPLVHGMESVYQDLVRRDLDMLGIRDDFYPVGGASTYSLFYLIIRISKELPVKSVLELGAGETTRLLDALRKSGALRATCTTLEHDPEWAARVSQLVSHDVVPTQLKPKVMAGKQYHGYDLAPISVLRDIDLLIIDGPPASTEHLAFARLGAVELIDRLNADNFVVILDDTHRHGEMFLAEQFERTLFSRDIQFSKGQIITSKRQTIIARGAFERACFY